MLTEKQLGNIRRIKFTPFDTDIKHYMTEKSQNLKKSRMF